MSESSRGIVQMENGPLAAVIFNPDGTYQVEKILRKAALGKPSLRDVGELIATMPGDDSAGSAGSYARIDLV